MLFGQNHNRIPTPPRKLRKAFKKIMSPEKSRVRFQDLEAIPMATPSPVRQPNILSSSPITRSGHYHINRVLRPTCIFRMECDVLWSPLEWKLGDSIPQDALGDYATFPPATRLRLTTTLLPWPIEVWPSQTVAYGEPYISVLDILKAIYNCVKTPVTEEEYNRNGGDGTYSYNYVVTKKATLAFYKRCQAFGMDTMRRVDYLMGRTHFKGLVQSAISPTDWEIIFD